MGAKIKNQNYNNQVTRREKQEKCNRATLHTRRVCKKNDIISRKDCLHPSKHLAFLSLQIHHIKHVAQVSKNLYCDVPWIYLAKTQQLNYLMWHNPMKSKRTKHQGPQLKSYGAMKQKMIHWLSTPLTPVTPIKNNKESYPKKLTMKRKPPLEEPLIATPTSKGKKE